MLVRNDLGEIHHVEFQSTNEAEFAFRMLKYFVYFREEYGEPIHQCCFYIGKEPCWIPPVFQELGTTHKIRIVNLQDYSADDLLASPEWSDNLWALGARGDRPVVLHAILLRLAELSGEEKKDALAALTAYSGILNLDGLLKQELKEFSMVDINLEENAVIRPLIEKAEQRGRTEGVAEGRRQQLMGLLAEKFGPLPAAANERVSGGTLEQIDRWARQLLRANSLEDTLK